MIRKSVNCAKTMNPLRMNPVAALVDFAEEQPLHQVRLAPCVRAGDASEQASPQRIDAQRIERQIEDAKLGGGIARAQQPPIRRQSAAAVTPARPARQQRR